MILKYSRNPHDKFGLGYELKDKNNFQKASTYVSSKLYCSYCGKTGHITSKCIHKRKLRYEKTSRTNKKGPKNIWAPKNMIISFANELSRQENNSNHGYLDSGYSRHMMGEMFMFQELRPKPGG